MYNMLVCLSTQTQKQLRENLLGWEQYLLCACGYEDRVQFLIAVKKFCALSQTDENISAALTLPDVLKVKCAPMRSYIGSWGYRTGLEIGGAGSHSRSSQLQEKQS